VSSTSTTQSDAQLVGAGYEAFAASDFAALDRLFHANATWNHRNNDRYGGVHSGKDAIFAFFAGSAQDAAGTLRGAVTSVEQFVGAPEAVTSFWA
jgi:ketosteroid isomerase-like protein